MTLVCTHLESGFGGNHIRVHQAGLLLDEIESLPSDRAVVFGGDLNAKPESEPIEVLRQGGFDIEPFNLMDEPTSQGEVEGRVKRLGNHIDYVMGRGLVAVKSDESPAVVLATYPNDADGLLLSDHAVVSVDIRRPQSR